jgi:hypothetical protein
LSGEAKATLFPRANEHQRVPTEMEVMTEKMKFIAEQEIVIWRSADDQKRT